MTGEMVQWSLQDYAEEINQQYTILLQAEETAENAIFRIGQLLNEVKAKLPHGEFMPWVKSNCKFSHQHGLRLMRIEKRRDEFIEPPTSILGAERALRRLSQIESPDSIWISPQEAIQYNNPRGKLYRKLADLYEYVSQVREEGYHKHMVMEDEMGTTAELLLRLADLLRTARNEMDPHGSHIREVKS